MTYLLDTDICIDVLRQRSPAIERFLALKRIDVAVSAITEGELRTGAAKSSAPTKTLRSVESFLRPIEILAFSSEDTDGYARIRSGLEKAGMPIGPLDTLIAAQALSRALILVTGNEREFGRITGLRLESWR